MEEKKSGLLASVLLLQMQLWETKVKVGMISDKRENVSISYGVSYSTCFAEAKSLVWLAELTHTV
jgi:hypothetical protein